MQGTESDVIGGFNNFIEQQKLHHQGKITFSLYKFNSYWSRILNDLPIEEIRPLTSGDYTPGGLTALYDTIGNAIADIENQSKYTKSEHKASMVMMVIITDGQENASREYDSRKIKQMIKELEQSENWQFIYLGADLENFADADILGLRHKISSKKIEMKKKFDVISEHTVRFRMANPDKDQNSMWNDFMDDLAKDED
jgi:uncharacterized protein YegL